MSKGFCLFFIIVFVFNAIVGAWLSDYFFSNVFGKHLGWFADFIIGLFATQLLLIADFVIWIAKMLGAVVPIIH